MATSKKPTKPDYNKIALTRHKKTCGKVALQVKGSLKSKEDWSTMYTPGVAAVSAAIAKDPKKAREYTSKRNSVAVVSDGSAVLGLGNIGALGSLPVMEGKCAIFKALADVDAWPIVLDTQDTEEIIAAVKAIAPGFGGINLEDIGAPKCFEIEERLKRDLPIPVMHDDQHGTAIVVLAGLINAAKVVKKPLKSVKVVIVGAGAAGRAIALILAQAGVTDIIITDSKGIIHKKRADLVGYKQELAAVTNPRNIAGEVMEAVTGADVLVGVSGPKTVSPAHVRAMADKAIVFALANPTPEILPEEAKAAGAYIVATGRSDYPNQVNNSLAFPGVFRGALDNNVRDITDEMKVKAAKKIAAMVKNPTATNIIPTNTAKGLVKAVASVIR